MSLRTMALQRCSMWRSVAQQRARLQERWKTAAVLAPCPAAPMWPTTTCMLQQHQQAPLHCTRPLLQLTWLQQRQRWPQQQLLLLPQQLQLLLLCRQLRAYLRAVAHNQQAPASFQAPAHNNSSSSSSSSGCVMAYAAPWPPLLISGTARQYVTLLAVVTAGLWPRAVL